MQIVPMGMLRATGGSEHLYNWYSVHVTHVLLATVCSLCGNDVLQARCARSVRSTHSSLTRVVKGHQTTASPEWGSLTLPLQILQDTTCTTMVRSVFMTSIEVVVRASVRHTCAPFRMLTVHGPGQPQTHSTRMGHVGKGLKGCRIDSFCLFGFTLKELLPPTTHMAAERLTRFLQVFSAKLKCYANVCLATKAVLLKNKIMLGLSTALFFC